MTVKEVLDSGARTNLKPALAVLGSVAFAVGPLAACAPTQPSTGRTRTSPTSSRGDLAIEGKSSNFQCESAPAPTAPNRSTATSVVARGATPTSDVAPAPGSADDHPRSTGRVDHPY